MSKLIGRTSKIGPQNVKIGKKTSNLVEKTSIKIGKRSEIGPKNVKNGSEKRQKQVQKTSKLVEKMSCDRKTSGPKNVKIVVEKITIMIGKR